MSSTIIKPSAAIRQNYNDISNLAKETDFSHQKRRRRSGCNGYRNV